MEPIEILLVEDNMNDAELAISALNEYNLANKVEHVKDGPEALDFIFCKGKYKDRVCVAPKVILLDLKLPKLNGLEVLKKIKEDNLAKKIPVIMLTSSQEEPDIEAAYSLGANSYIVKPVEFDKFVEALKNVGYYWMLINQSPLRK
ncbi:MAG TPA: response regulator [Cytophagaceae bacterium]|jgi:two-component system response regulator